MVRIFPPATALDPLYRAQKGALDEHKRGP